MVGKAIDNTTTFLSLISLIALDRRIAWRGDGDVLASAAADGHDRRDESDGRASQPGHADLSDSDSVARNSGRIDRRGGGRAGAEIVSVADPARIRAAARVPWDWSFSLQGMSLGILATLLFTLPPLLSIRNVRPSLVFRREYETTPRSKAAGMAREDSELGSARC